MTWETDTQYTEARIRKVEPMVNGWGIYFDGGLVIGCTSDCVSEGFLECVDGGRTSVEGALRAR